VPEAVGAGSCPALIDVLAQVKDPRRAQGRRYSLASILALVCAATLCGYRSYGAVAEWGRHYGRDLAERLGFRQGRTPSVGTLHAVLRHLDRRELERVLGEWAERVAQALGEASAVAVDGKTLRGSLKQGALQTHLLSAVSHGLGLTLAQEAVGEKTNEVGAVQRVLAGLVLEGRVVTVDALLTQKEVAATIRQKGGTS
jgi:hypothetical protein